MQRVRHANRGRLLLRTPGPVPFGTCICSTCWDQRHSLPIRPVCDIITGFNIFTESDISPNIGFHGASATGVACRQGTLTPPDTWSCPTLGLACVLMSRPLSPELVLSPDFWISNTPRYFSFASHFRRLFLPLPFCCTIHMLHVVLLLNSGNSKRTTTLRLVLINKL